MSTPIAKQILIRMKARNLSTSKLERKAGLKTHAVRNIVRGISKRPNVLTLHAIADNIGCTVDDLLQTYDIFIESGDNVSKNKLLNRPYDSSNLMSDVVKFIDKKSREKSLTVQQILTAIEQIYLQSLNNGLGRVDTVFAEWFVELMER